MLRRSLSCRSICDFFGRLVFLSAPGPQAAQHGVHDGPGAVFFAHGRTLRPALVRCGGDDLTGSMPA